MAIISALKGKRYALSTESSSYLDTLCSLDTQDLRRGRDQKKKRECREKEEWGQDNKRDKKTDEVKGEYRGQER